MDPDPDLGGPKTRGSGSGSATLLLPVCVILSCHLLSTSCLIPVITLSTTVSSELGLPHPLSCKRVWSPPPPPNQRGGGTLACVWGSPKSDDWRKSLALCLHCACHVLSSSYQFFFVKMQNYLLLQVFSDDLIFALLWYISFVSVSL